MRQVTGDLLEALSEQHLQELGITLVGHRLVLIRELTSLRRHAHTRERGRVIWRGEEVLHRSGLFGYLKEAVTCVPCCREPETYLLSASELVLVSTNHMFKGRWCCPKSERTTRTIDLSSIANVTA